MSKKQEIIEGMQREVEALIAEVKERKESLELIPEALWEDTSFTVSQYAIECYAPLTDYKKIRAKISRYFPRKYKKPEPHVYHNWGDNWTVRYLLENFVGVLSLRLHFTTDEATVQAKFLKSTCHINSHTSTSTYKSIVCER